MRIKLNKIIIISLTAIMAVLLSLRPIYARSGCCSWHGGVCGCDCTVGRQVCCDGTYSPSCTCPLCPKPTVCSPKPDVPQTARWDFIPEINGLQNLAISWGKTQYSDRFSVSLTKVAGSDPGPEFDTTASNYYFENIGSGKWYFNLKAGNNCGWSQVYYWEINIPTPEPIPSSIPTSTPISIFSPSPTPTQTPSLISTPEILGKKTEESTGRSEWLALILLLPIAVGSFLLIKGRKK